MLGRRLSIGTLSSADAVHGGVRVVCGEEQIDGLDWQDMIIGDVSGHGLASGVVMGRVRSALRAYALITDDPAQALTMLDRKVQHFEAGSLTTGGSRSRQRIRPWAPCTP